MLAGSGRTDSGVHARGQVVSFTTGCGIPAANLKRAMNSILPPDITVIASQEAEEGFHARFSAKWKRYCYRIVLNGDYDPFIRNYAWQMQNTKLNIEAMNMAAGFLLGTHDFSFFRSSGSVQSSPVKQYIKPCGRKKHRVICFLLLKATVFYTAWCATLFGTLLKQGSAEKVWNSLRKNFDKAERHFKISPAPPQGLYLDYVGYTEYLPLKNLRILLDKHKQMYKIYIR